jgi:hypothetical protein
MVLVRRRNEFVNALVRELKREQVEVAGVDRLNLGEELAIQDLLAMARFVLLPQDDLNLACLLKSPLIGLDEDSSSPWPGIARPSVAALRERAREPASPRRTSRSSQWLARADYTTPFDFFAQALGPEHGRSGCSSGWAARPPIRSTSCWRARCSTSERGGVAAGLPALVRGRRRRDQARSRRQPPAGGAHPHRARLQGPAGADRLPARHHARPARLDRLLARRRRHAAVAAARRRRQRGRARLARRGARARRWRSRTACSTSP